MGRISLVSISDISDLLALLYLLPLLQKHLGEMGVERIDERAVRQSMSDDHHISPTDPFVSCEFHDSVCDRVNRISEIVSSRSVPVLSQMCVCSEGLGVPIPFSIRRADRKVEAGRNPIRVLEKNRLRLFETQFVFYGSSVCRLFCRRGKAVIRPEKGRY